MNVSIHERLCTRLLLTAPIQVKLAFLLLSNFLSGLGVPRMPCSTNSILRHKEYLHQEIMNTAHQARETLGARVLDSMPRPIMGE